MKPTIALFVFAFLTACQSTTIAPTAKMKPALAERLAVLNTDEPMPPAEGPEDVAPVRAQDPNSKSRFGSVAIVTLVGGVGDTLI